MQNKYKKQLSIFETRRGKMRIRFKPWARPELEASSFYIDNPEEYKEKSNNASDIVPANFPFRDIKDAKSEDAAV